MRQYPAPSLDRGIHPLRLLAFIASAALCGPVILYLAFLILFWLMPGGVD